MKKVPPTGNGDTELLVNFISRNRPVLVGFPSPLSVINDPTSDALKTYELSAGDACNTISVIPIDLVVFSPFILLTVNVEVLIVVKVETASVL